MTPREQFLSDVIVTAIEGGVGYWSVCLQYQWEGNVVISDSKPHGSGTRAVISPLDTDDIYTITTNTIRTGIAAIKLTPSICEKRIRDAILVADRENDAGDIDADAADVVVQAALFGEVRYA